MENNHANREARVPAPQEVEGGKGPTHAQGEGDGNQLIQGGGSAEVKAPTAHERAADARAYSRALVSGQTADIGPRRKRSLQHLNNACLKLEQLNRTLRAIKIEPLELRQKALRTEFTSVNCRVRELKRRQKKVEGDVIKTIGTIKSIANAINWGKAYLLAKDDIKAIKLFLKRYQNRNKMRKQRGTRTVNSELHRLQSP